MQTYTVHERPNPPTNRVKRAERLVFVREGFSWKAALFAPLWMLVHRMWLVLLLYIVAVVALDLALMAADVSPQWIGLLTIAVHAVIGFEAGSLRRWTLDRRGWKMLGAVTGRSEPECERRFFQAWLGDKEEEPGEGTVRLRTQTATGTAGPMPAAGLRTEPVGSEA